ncbi:MAG TPA: AgmX/PglI C-terminal domain-containing protein [Vulgatibacter sp.]|nr:AgmX/PglI C-terminal domain-containing protein [Vulgatibacter sp.]
MAIPLTLRVYRDGVVVETREFTRDLVKIGRMATAHLPIDDPRVSRIHAVIQVAEDGISVTDMGSVEGTWVNGRRISRVSLSSGDSVVMGDTRVEVLVGPASDHPLPAEAAKAGASAASAAAAQEAGATVQASAAPAAGVATEGVAPAAQQAAASAAPAATPAGAASAAQQATTSPDRAAGGGTAAEGAASAPQQAAVAQGEAGASSPPDAASVDADPSSAQQAAGAEAPRSDLPLGVGPAAAANRPVPWPADRSHRSLALEVRFFWGDQQLGAASFEEEERITVGAEKGATFDLQAANLPADPFPLVEKVEGAWHLRFGPSMEGELIRGGKAERLIDIARARRARTVGEAIAEVELPPDAAAWLDLGNIRAELCYRPKARKVFVPLAQRIDYTFINLLLIVFAFFMGSIITFGNQGREVDVTADDLFTNQARFTRLLLTPPEQRKNPFLDKIDLKAPGKEATVQAPGQEGKAGRRDAPVRNTRSAPRAIQPDDKEIVKNQGLLAMLGSGSNSGLSTIFGKGGLGGDLKGAIGGITGASVGDAHGFGGLGLRGTGVGGGGEGQTVGVGAIGTKGRGGGIGDYGKGAGAGLGKKASSEVTIDTSSVVVVGYDRELVRRVVQQHHSQLRYCFENELIRNPKLGGRIQVKWIITGNGTVSNAQLASTTMNNAKVERCIVSRVRGWQFPPPKGGGIATITYPFVFRPAGN